MNEHLAPCPFCGGTPAIATESRSGFYGWRIKCTGPCGLKMPGNLGELFTDREIAIAAWNRREGDAAEVERLERELAAMTANAERERLDKEDARREIAWLRERDEDAEALRCLFALQQARMGEATALWQQATGQEGVLPDLGALLAWLLAEAARLRSRCAELEGLLRRVDQHRGHEWSEMGSQFEQTLAAEIRAALESGGEEG
jgi:hypothetical protein